MRVTRIAIYPIKGAREISLDQAELRARGLAGDRRWMVVDPQGQFLQQRVVASLALVRSALHPDGSLTVEAPGMPSLQVRVPAGDDRRRVTVWGDVVDAADAGSDAQAWFTQLLQRDCHLVFLDQRAERPVNHQRARAGDVVSFADAMPCLLASEASLEDLNRRIGRELPMTRFRPNITIDGAEPWAEDHWSLVQVGNVLFEVTHPCARCVVTTVDQQSGRKDADGEPLRTLASFRAQAGAVHFGVNAIGRALGIVRVGDEVTVLR